MGIRLFSLDDEVDVLLQNGPDDQWYRCENQIVKSDVKVIIKCLPRISTKERKKILRNGKNHVFVKEVKNHLRNSHIVPSSMNEQQSP